MKKHVYYVIAVLFLVAFVTSFNYGGCLKFKFGDKDKDDSGSSKPRPPAQVTGANLSNGATDVPTSSFLNWFPAAGATSYDVYFGITITGWSPVTNTISTGYNPGTLSYSTLYYWRIDSKNAAGTTSGNVWSFTTEAGDTPPSTCSTNAATDVTANSATLNGTVNPNGVDTNAYFQWGTTTSYGNTTTSQDIGNGTSNVSVNADISGLSANTLYNFRVVGTNSSGTTNGNNRTFTTDAPLGSPPTCTTDPADNITSNSVRLNGTVNPNGVPTTAYFNYGLTTSYSVTTTSQAIGSGAISLTVSATISSLTSNAEYNFRVVGTSSAGTTYGNNLTFTTTLSTEIATPVSGTYFSNTTWTLSYSPYLVVGDVQVALGVTLTIEPGVVVKYSGAYQIFVKGSIIANGTSSNPITFTSSAPGVSSSATSAIQIRFADTNLANSQISYVTMEWANKAIFTDAGNIGTLNVSNLQLINNTISQGTNSYSSPRGIGSITLSNATISNSTVEVSNSALKIQSSNMTDSTLRLNYAASNASIEVISNTSFTRCQFFSNRDAWSQYVKVLDSTFTDSNIKWGNGYSDRPYEIQRCNLYNSYIEGFTRTNIIISSTTISFTPGSTIGINCNTSDYAANLTIQNSKVIGNGSGIGINITNGTISNTEIVNTATAIKIATNPHVGATGASVSGSNFINASTYAIENRTTLNINATNNYWGTTDENVIKQKIFDYYDDINYGIVSYNPYRNSPLN